MYADGDKLRFYTSEAPCKVQLCAAAGHYPLMGACSMRISRSEASELV